jgi:hypothetical protein
VFSHVEREDGRHLKWARTQGATFIVGGRAISSGAFDAKSKGDDPQGEELGLFSSSFEMATRPKNSTAS